jgi:phosphopantetheine binding protein
MVPARVVVLPALPLTSNGKVDRAALPLVAAEAKPVGAAPQGATEALIADIWCELLGLPNVSRSANFFDLGGHSLLVIQIQRRLKGATGHEVPIVEMFRHSTIQALAAHLDGRSQANAAVQTGIERARARRALLTGSA